MSNGPMHVLVTGGAGFIGSHLVDRLVGEGLRIRVLDALDPQVHGERRTPPPHLSPRAELIVGDVRDRATVRRALAGIDAVVHLAASVGVGQSMYRIADYVAANALGTATLLEEVVAGGVKRLVVASSMSVYGEGAYRTRSGALRGDVRRKDHELRAGRWEPEDDEGSPLEPVPTAEDKPLRLESVYALSKYDQEQLCLMVGRAYRVPTVALRLFNVYGPRQALSNPYTGVLAIFAARLLNGKPPLVFEDGQQRRDFVSVHDVARAFHLALVEPAAAGQTINVGSGRSHTVRHIAVKLAAALGKPLEPQITGSYRVGDIRHCFADVGLAERLLGYRPEVELERGLGELAGWLATQAATDSVERAHGELRARGLAVAT